MRTSNKILLGAFIAALLAAGGTITGLYIKYKNHDWIAIGPGENRYDRFLPGRASYVYVTGVNSLTIIPADTLMVEIEKRTDGRAGFSMRSDSLIVAGDIKGKDRSAASQQHMNNQDIILHLPSGDYINAENCGIHLAGRKDTAGFLAYQFKLQKSVLSLGNRYDNENGLSAMFFNRIRVKAFDNSQINLVQQITIDTLAVQLEGHSSIEDNNDTRVRQLFFSGDDSSTVRLQSANLKNLKNVSSQ